MRPRRLSPDSVRERLAGLQGWSLADGKLHRVLHFADFAAAFAFMTAAAAEAEELDHHPEWFNVYARVEVWLTTHDAEGLTELDFELARRMQALAPEGAADGISGPPGG